MTLWRRASKIISRVCSTPSFCTNIQVKANYLDMEQIHDFLIGGFSIMHMCFYLIINEALIANSRLIR